MDDETEGPFFILWTSENLQYDSIVPTLFPLSVLNEKWIWHFTVYITAPIFATTYAV